MGVHPRLAVPRVWPCGRWPTPLKGVSHWVLAFRPFSLRQGRHQMSRSEPKLLALAERRNLGLPQQVVQGIAGQASGSSGKCHGVRAGPDRSRRELWHRNAQPDRHGIRLSRQVGLGWPEALNRSEIPLRSIRRGCWQRNQPSARPPNGLAGRCCSALDRRPVLSFGVISNESDQWHQALPSRPMAWRNTIRASERRSHLPPNPIPWPSSLLAQGV